MPIESPEFPAFVLRKLESINDVVGTNGFDENDIEFIVFAFEDIRFAGYEFDPVKIRDWALSTGWSAENAEQLRSLAAKVEKGVSMKKMLKLVAIEQTRRLARKIQRRA